MASAHGVNAFGKIGNYFRHTGKKKKTTQQQQQQQQHCSKDFHRFNGITHTNLSNWSQSTTPLFTDLTIQSRIHVCQTLVTMHTHTHTQWQCGISDISSSIMQSRINWHFSRHRNVPCRREKKMRLHWQGWIGRAHMNEIYKNNNNNNSNIHEKLAMTHHNSLVKQHVKIQFTHFQWNMIFVHISCVQLFESIKCNRCHLRVCYIAN